MLCALHFDTIQADLVCTHLAEGVGALTRIHQQPRMAALVSLRQVGQAVIMTVATHEGEAILTTGQAGLLCKKYKQRVGHGSACGVGMGKKLSVYKSNDGGINFAHVQDFRICFETQMNGVACVVGVHGDGRLMVFKDGSWCDLMVDLRLSAMFGEMLRQPTDLFVSRPLEIDGKVTHVVSTLNSSHAIVMFVTDGAATFGCTQRINGAVLFGGDSRYSMIARVEFQNGQAVVQIGRIENAVIANDIVVSLNAAARAARRLLAAGGKTHAAIAV